MQHKKDLKKISYLYIYLLIFILKGYGMTVCHFLIAGADGEEGVIRRLCALSGRSDKETRSRRSPAEQVVIMAQKPSYAELKQRIKDLEERNEQNVQFLNDILNYIPDLIFVKDRQHRWVLLNEAFCSALGHRREELIGKTDYDFHTKEQADIFWEKDDLVFKTEGINVNEEVYTDPRGNVRTILTSKAAFRDPSGRKLLVGVAHDITQRKRAEQDRERLIAELKEALAKVQTLTGLLPICASCKKIRDDEGYWSQIESYLKKYASVEVSHGMCPDCAECIYGHEPWYRKIKGGE